IAISEPVDVSLGSDAEKKAAFEEWYQQNFKQFEAEIAPSDFEFQANTLSNGKISDVGGYYTAFTDMDYVTPPLSPERIAKLKPITRIMGKRDGLVRIGREDKFDTAFGPWEVVDTYEDQVRVLSNPAGRSHNILLPDGPIWKSKGPDDKHATG